MGDGRVRDGGMRDGGVRDERVKEWRGEGWREGCLGRFHTIRSLGHSISTYAVHGFLLNMVSGPYYCEGEQVPRNKKPHRESFLGTSWEEVT